MHDKSKVYEALTNQFSEEGHHLLRYLKTWAENYLSPTTMTTAGWLWIKGWVATGETLRRELFISLEATGSSFLALNFTEPNFPANIFALEPLRPSVHPLWVPSLSQRWLKSSTKTQCLGITLARGFTGALFYNLLSSQLFTFYSSQWIRGWKSLTPMLFPFRGIKGFTAYS